MHGDFAGYREVLSLLEKHTAANLSYAGGAHETRSDGESELYCSGRTSTRDDVAVLDNVLSLVGSALQLVFKARIAGSAATLKQAMLTQDHGSRTDSGNNASSVVLSVEYLAQAYVVE